ncbi:MAG: LamG-like jellyroll fold domain-containing protein [Niabella sp.]
MKKYILFLSFISILFTGLQSCKKYADPAPIFEEGDSLVVKPPRKVLFIAIDGVPGAEMKAIMPATVSSILPHSKYSWDVMSEVVTTTVSSWKTLLSGVNSSKHNILGYDSTFALVDDGEDHEHEYIPYYPSFFNYILTTPQSDLRTAFITGWGDLIRYGAPEIVDRMTVTSDMAVKDSAVRLLKTGTDDIIVANFSDPAKAGLAYGFSHTISQYKAAVDKVDGYIGEMLQALKTERASYKNEEWLVIIASTHGGINKTFGGASDAEKRTFTIYHNDLIKQQEFTAEGVFLGTEFSGNGTSAPLNVGKLYNANEFNIGAAGKQMTLQFNFKSPRPFNYPHFFGKQLRAFNGVGWTMFTSSAGRFNLSIRGSSEKRLQPASDVVFDNEWHNLAFAIFDSAGGRWVKRFVDGKRIDDGATANITSLGDISNTEPLLLGWGTDPGYGALEFSIANLALFNTALTDAEIINSGCISADKINTHPKFANLVNYYPGTDGFGSKLNNTINPAKPILLEGNFSWGAIANTPCSFNATSPSGSTITQWYNVDIPSQIFYWCRVDDWGKEGRRWLNEYDIEFIK